MADPRPAQGEYWQEPPPAEKGLTPAYWNDPSPELQGMLTAERIAEYDRVVGGMIRPFEQHLLKTASYELTLGPNCVVEGKDVVLGAGRRTLEIPPNSIALVPMRQVLCLPHYIVGRFDLQIKFIYKGLLLGTGPQVDPGFQGALSCPLHNISNDPVYIDLDEPFAKLDFAKTVPHRDDIRAAWAQIKTEKGLADWVRSSAAPADARLFKRGEPEWRRPIEGYLEGHRRPRSSVRVLKDELQQFQTWVRRLSYGSSAVIFITILVGIPAFVFSVVDLANDELATKTSVTKSDAALQRRLDRQQQEIRKLNQRITRPRR